MIITGIYYIIALLGTLHLVSGFLIVLIAMQNRKLNGIIQRLNYMMMSNNGSEGDYVARHTYGKDFWSDKDGIHYADHFYPKPKNRPVDLSDQKTQKKILKSL